MCHRVLYFLSFLVTLLTHTFFFLGTGNGDGTTSGYLSETEVYAKVAKLFTNHEDLLAEFRQFLPDTGPTTGVSSLFQWETL